MRFVPLEEIKQDEPSFRFVPLDSAVPPRGNVAASPTAAEVTSAQVGVGATDAVQYDEADRLSARYPAPEEPGFFGRMANSFGIGVDQAKNSAVAVNVSAQQDALQKSQAKLAALEAAGKGQAPDAGFLRAQVEHYGKRQGQYVADLAGRMGEASKADVYPGVAALGNAKSFGEGWDVIQSDPLNIIANLGAQSFPTMIPGLLTSMVNPAAGAAVMGASSFGVELGSSVLQYAQQNGVDTKDPNALRQFYSNPSKLDEAKAYALKRASIIGTADALGGRLASKVLAPAALKSPLAKGVANVGVQIPAQAGVGAAGEAGAQIATDGKISSPGEVVAEAAGGLFTAPIEVGSMAVGVRNEMKAAKREPTFVPLEETARTEPTFVPLEEAKGPAPDPAPPVPPAPTVGIDGQQQQGNPPNAAIEPPAPQATAQTQGVEAPIATGVESPATGPVPATGEPGGVEAPGVIATSGVYQVPDAITADGPAGETVRLTVRPDGSAFIMRANGDLIDITAMVKAGFTSERAIAQSIADDVSGAGVMAVDQPPAERTERVSTVTGRQVETRYKVVDASELVAAGGGLQPRDRSRASSDEQINQIASQLDPNRLGASSEADRGAPIVGPDNVVESGNGRTQAIARAYAMYPEKAQEYRDYLTAQGFDTTGIQNPVLVRERLTPMSDAERRLFVQEANQAATMDLTPVERAKIDVSAMADGVVDVWAGGDVGDVANQDFVRAFIGNLPQPQRNGMLDDRGGLSPDGATRIRRAMLAAAYEDSDLLSTFMESPDDGAKSVGNSLFDNAGAWIQMRRMAKAGTIPAGVDVTPQLVEAARIADQLRKTKGKVREWLAQQDMTQERDPIVDAFLRGFYNEDLSRAVGRDAINEVIGDYVRYAKAQDTEDIFGGQPPAPQELVTQAVESRNERNKAPNQSSLLDAGDVGSGPRLSGRGQPARDSGIQGDRPRVAGQGRQPTTGEQASNDRRPAQGAQPAGAGNQSEAGSVNGRAPATARRESPPIQADREDAAGSTVANQRVKGAGRDKFGAASSTSRQSIWRDAFVDLGYDPERAENLPPAQQIKILTDGLREKFGLDFVGGSARAGTRDTIDQMLDAYRSMQFMANVLDLPATAIGMNDTLSIAIVSEGKGFLGAYTPTGAAGPISDGLVTNGPTVLMPGRSNSFAHEWGHALDFYLVERFGAADNTDLSGNIRKGEMLSQQFPESVAGSFRLLMNSLFFDQSEQASKIMDLERRIEASALRGVDAVRLKAELAKITDGSSQSRAGRSQYFKTSRDFAESNGLNPSYWIKPTEMLARSFEAYVAHKVEAAGGTTEFIAKGDFAYLDNTDDRLAKTFPKDSDRFNVFRAYDLLFDAIREEQVLGAGASATVPAGIRLSDPNTYFDRHSNDTKDGALKRALAEEKRAFQVFARRGRELDARPKDQRSIGRRIVDPLRAFIETNRGVLLSLERHYRNNRRAAEAIRKVTERIATDPGSGRATYTDGTFSEAVERNSRRFSTRIANITRSLNLDLMTPSEKAQLADVLTATGLEAFTASPKVAKAAAQLRELVNDLYYYNRNAGLEIGYVENGYLPRLMDEAIVTDRAAEFVKAATNVYKIIFERDNIRPSTEGIDLIAALGNLGNRMREAGIRRQSDPELALYVKARQQLGMLNGILNRAEAAGDQDAIDIAQANLNEFIDQSMDIFEAAYDYTMERWSTQAAAEYQTRIAYGSPESFSSHSPSGSYLKNRSLPPEADKILAEFYIQDPVERIGRYAEMSVRKSEYNRRFGARRGESNSQLYRMLDEMIKAGVRKDDREMIESIVKQVTGTERSKVPQQAQRMLGAVHALGQMTLLGRVVLTSLAEPMTVAIQTGRPLDALKAIALTVQEIVATGSVKERRKMAAVMGIVSSDISDEIVTNRLGGTVGESGMMQKATANFFRRAGLTGLTNAQRRASMSLAGRYVLDMAHTLDDKDASANDKGMARDELRDAGLTDDEVDSFVEWSREFDTRMPRADEIHDVDGSLTNVGRAYAVMVGRLVNQAIQNPTAIDRPYMANTLFGRLTYGLLSFTMAFFRNVAVKSVKKIQREFDARGFSHATQVAAWQVMTPIATLYAGHLLTTVMREALLNPDKWDEEEKKDNLMPWLMQLAFSRSGFTGIADPLYNAILGVKYQRDLANLVTGPSFSYFLQAMQRIASYFVLNSENTNSAERNAVRGGYELAVQPSIAFLTGYVPGGPLVGYGLGASYAYMSSPRLKSDLQDMLAGEKNSGKGKTGETDDDSVGF